MALGAPAGEAPGGQQRLAVAGPRDELVERLTGRRRQDEVIEGRPRHRSYAGALQPDPAQLTGRVVERVTVSGASSVAAVIEAVSIAETMCSGVIRSPTRLSQSASSPVRTLAPSAELHMSARSVNDNAGPASTVTIGRRYQPLSQATSSTTSTGKWCGLELGEHGAVCCEARALPP